MKTINNKNDQRRRPDLPPSCQVEFENQIDHICHPHGWDRVRDDIAHLSNVKPFSDVLKVT